MNKKKEGEWVQKGGTQRIMTIVSHLIILYQTDLGSTYSCVNSKSKALSICTRFITLILPRIILFPHPDLGKPQTAGSELYSWKPSKCGWPGFRREKRH